MLLLIVFVVTLLESCQNKREQNEALLPTQNPQSQQRDETDDRLNATINSIALGMVKAAQNNSFRNFVHGKAADQFDGDDNVLLQTLANAETGLNLSDEILTGINMYKNQITSSDTIPYDILTDTTSINTGLDSFPYYDRNLYLQVYIPFIDEVNLNQMPIIAILIDNDTLLQGYKLNEDNTISVVTLTEDMAKSNLVWVVSVNEVVDNNGNIATSSVRRESHRGVDKYVMIESILISDKKEGWGAGKAEISFFSKHLEGCGASYQSDVVAAPFRKVATNELNQTLSISIFNGMAFLADNPANAGQGNAGYLTSQEFLAVMIYEKDAGTNKNKRNASFSNMFASCSNPGIYSSCNQEQWFSFSFYSKETAYGSTGDIPIPYQDMPPSTNNFLTFSTLNWTGGTFKLASQLN